MLLLEPAVVILWLLLMLCRKYLNSQVMVVYSVNIIYRLLISTLKGKQQVIDSTNTCICVAETSIESESAAF